jgi:hypothetical protein
VPKTEAPSLDALHAAAKLPESMPIEDEINPSLPRALDNKLESVLAADTDTKAIKVVMFTMRWINPDQANERLAGGVGAALAGGVGALVAAEIAAPSQRRDTLMCYFQGDYRGQSIEIKKIAPCPQGLQYCFGSSTLKPLDTSLTSTIDAMQKLAEECIADITTSITNTKALSAKTALR